MHLPFRPPKRSRRSTQYETAELITAEGPLGGRRTLRVLPLPVRIRQSLVFLVACCAAAAGVGVVVYSIETAGVPSDSGSSSLWQLFRAGVPRFAVAAVAMWACHLITTLAANRIRRIRASEGLRTSALAGVIAYPLYLACGVLAASLDLNARSVPLVATVGAIIFPAVIATLLAPLLIPRSPGPH